MLIGAIASFWLGRFPLQSDGRAPLQHLVPIYLGRFLFWVGVPLSILHFLRHADLSGGVWLAPAMAWLGVCLSLLCAGLWLHIGAKTWVPPDKGAFLLAAMLGNTGYIGYPVILLLPELGTHYFAWAVFYDLLGTFFAAYGLGVLIAAHYGRGTAARGSGCAWEPLYTLLRTPTLPAFLGGLMLRSLALPNWLDQGLRGGAWSMVMLSLILVGMRLQQIQSSVKVLPTLVATGIRLVITPLAVGLVLTLLGIGGPPRLVMVLQAGMPSALATLVLTETFNLDRSLAVTCVGVSSAVFLLTLPLWIWSFPP
jgi:hypothetical protein